MEHTMSDYGTHRILVGVDGSADSLAALDWAIGEARLRDLAVVAYHAWHQPESPEAEETLIAAGEQVLDQAIQHGAKHAADVPLTRTLVRGEPARRLSQASVDADLVVVGARGQSGEHGPGPVAAGVALHARCPVVVTRDGIDTYTDAATDGRLVVGVDGSPGSDIAVRFAFAEAARRHVPLHALHAPEATARPDEAAQRLRGWLRARATSYPGVAVTDDVVSGKPGPALLAAATGAALLVIGSRGHGVDATLLGSTTDAVLRDATCPTVLVR
jgi:nucleotide-binding universal stress UspA family protein